MKHLFLFISVLFLACSVQGQDIFKAHGFNKETLTLSKGRYEEVFTNKEVVQIGSVLLNTKTNKIVDFIDEDIEDVSFKSEHSSRFYTIDPMAALYPEISPYVYCKNNPIKFVDPDGRVVRLANNYAGGMENIAKIAATSFGSQVLSHLIGKSDVYTLKSTFWTTSSKYNPENLDIKYVADPWRTEVGGGAFNSMIAMGHEMFHAYDHSNYLFKSSNSGYAKNIAEPRAVSFENYLRNSFSLSPTRDGYGIIKGNFHQFPSNEKISDFTTLGNNSDKTSYGFSYTKTTTIVESYKKGFLGIRIPDKTRTETTTHYMTVSRDKSNNTSFQIYDDEDEYRKATFNW